MEPSTDRMLPRPYRPAEERMRPVSIIPGRQRWDVKAVRGRPVFAQLVEAALQNAPGIEEVQANPVTGRVLMRHDAETTPRQAARLLRRAVDQILARLRTSPGGRSGQVFTPVLGRRSDTAAAPTALQPGRQNSADGDRRRGAGEERARPSRKPALFVAGGVTAAAVLGGGTLLNLLANPLIGFGLFAVGTAIVVRKAWRRSAREAGESTAAAPHSHPLRRIVGHHKRRFARATMLSLLTQVAQTAMYTLIPMTFLVLVGGNLGFLTTLGLVGASAQLSALAVATAVSCLAMSGLGYAASVAWRGLGQAVEDDWRTRTFDHVQRLASADLESERTSRVTAVLTEDISQLGSFVGTTMDDAVQLVGSFAVLIPVFLLLAPQIAWVAFAPVPLVTWLSFRFHERAVADKIASGEHRARMNGRMADVLQAHSTVKANCTEEYEARRIADLSGAYCDSNKHTDRSAASQNQLLRLSAYAALVGTLLMGGLAVVGGQLSMQMFGPLVELPAQALWRLSLLGTIADQYQRTLAAFDRVQRLHDLPVEPDTGVCQLPAQQVRGAIELQRVTFAYPGRPPALRETSLTIAPGLVTGVVGATGAGKTTIAKLLMRFRQPSDGQVLFDGVDVQELALQELRGLIGYVSQEPFLFDASIAENIRYGTFDASHGQLVAAAGTAGADAFINALPDGYDTLVGERGAALSGGQKQRIALARTILRNPPVVILDEATSAVDNETEAAIQHALKAFGAHRTMIVIAHRLSTVRGADRIYVMGSGGHVVEQGKHEELVARGGTYANLWSLQTGEGHRLDVH